MLYFLLISASLFAGCDFGDVGGTDTPTLAECTCILTARDSGGDRVPASGAAPWTVCVEPGFDDVALATEVCDETWPETWSDDEYLDTPRCVCSCTITDVGCAP